MAVTFTDTAHGASAGAQASLTIASVVVPSGADELLVAVQTYNATAEQTISTVTWNGNSLSRIDVGSTKSFGGTDFWNFEVWKLDAPTPATGSVVITPTASVQILGIAFSVNGAASSPVYRGSPAMLETEGEDIVYDVATAQNGDVCALLYGYSTEPDTDPTGSGTATLIVAENGTTFTTGYLRAYSFTANAAAPDLTVSTNAYGFGGAMGLAFIEGGGGGGSAVPAIVHHLKQQGVM